jgi:hypothetical protein
MGEIRRAKRYLTNRNYINYLSEDRAFL